MERPRAVFSPDRVYRYQLWREFDLTNASYVNIIGLNGSKAAEDIDDPTSVRCINFAKSWGFGALCMTNLFGFCATEPEDMKAAADPIGPENDRHILEVATGANLCVAAWGANGGFRERDAEVLRLLSHHMIAVHCMGRTLGGFPKHPLYLPGNVKPERFDRFQTVG